MTSAGCPRSGGRRPTPSGPGWELGAEVVGAATVHGLAIVPGAAGPGSVPAAVIVASETRVRRLGRDGAVVWAREVGADAGRVALDGDLALVAVSGTASTSAAVPGLAGGLRGEPGAALLALAAADGAVRWTVGAGSTRWSTVSAVTAAGDGFVVTGSFAGTLRVGDATVTAAGGVDGFAASIDRAGKVRWLRRMGGDSSDAITGAAALGGGRVAIAGTFTGPAELGDSELLALADKTLAADGFVAVIEPDGRVAWARAFGSADEDTCAGVAALTGGAVAVAGTVRGEVDVAGRRLEARGAADGLVAVFGADASVKSAWLVGGEDFDGLTAIGGSGSRIVVAGWFTGSLPTGERAEGVDDAMVGVADLDGATSVLPFPAAGTAELGALAVDAAGWAVAEGGRIHVRGF